MATHWNPFQWSVYITFGVSIASIYKYLDHTFVILLLSKECVTMMRR